VLGKFGSKLIQTQFESNQTSGFRFSLENSAAKPNSLVLVWEITDHPKWFQTWFTLGWLTTSACVVGSHIFILEV
jgi:hypothetical protein